MESLIKELFKHRKIAIAIIQEYYSQVVDLYCHLGLGNKTDEDIINDCISSYLSIEEGRNDDMWLWYNDGQNNGAISLKTSKIFGSIDEQETINDITEETIATYNWVKNDLKMLYKHLGIKYSRKQVLNDIQNGTISVHYMINEIWLWYSYGTKNAIISLKDGTIIDDYNIIEEKLELI